MKIALYNCLRFTCPHCESICIFPSFLYETLYTCDACEKNVILTADELMFDGVQVNQNDIEVTGTVKDAD